MLTDEPAGKPDTFTSKSADAETMLKAGSLVMLI